MSLEKDSADDRQAVNVEENSDRNPPTAAAKRALTEAAERRRKKDTGKMKTPVEIGGREGPDPVRYGDWEKDGIISDF